MLLLRSNAEVIAKGPMKRLARLLVLSVVLTLAVGARAQDKSHSEFDVLHYDAQLEPDIANKSITGKVLIQLVSTVTQLKAIDLDCGELTIDSVRESG